MSSVQICILLRALLGKPYFAQSQIQAAWSALAMGALTRNLYSRP